jgi:hypothetical protein
MQLPGAWSQRNKPSCISSSRFSTLSTHVIRALLGPSSAAPSNIVRRSITPTRKPEFSASLNIQFHDVQTVKVMKTRVLGCALILLCVPLVWQLHASVISLPLHEARVGELILAALVTLSGIGGAIMIAAGDTLFETPK